MLNTLLARLESIKENLPVEIEDAAIDGRDLNKCWRRERILFVVFTGGRYDPISNSWTAVSSTSAPGPRSGHTALWTGSEMIIWGGYKSGYFNDGGRYDPVGNIWRSVNTNGAPVPRSEQTAVWSGNEMIIWGGTSGGPDLIDGGRYSPQSNTWIMLNTASAPGGRTDHTAVWTGSEMIIWAGYSTTSQLNDTWSYTPGRALYLYQRP